MAFPLWGNITITVGNTDEVDTTLPADQMGEHTLVLTANGKDYQFKKTFGQGDNITLPNFSLQAGYAILNIFEPDETLYNNTVYLIQVTNPVFNPDTSIVTENISGAGMVTFNALPGVGTYTDPDNSDKLKGLKFILLFLNTDYTAITGYDNIAGTINFVPPAVPTLATIIYLK